MGRLLRRGARKTPSLRQEILALPLRAKLRLPWLLLRDPAVPLTAKAMIPLALVYLVLPGDLFADVVPVVGQLDDAVVITFALALFLRLCPDDTVRLHLDRLKAGRGD
jgi:uncharacterized membrane protein YkvA (DUF1232 family)